ncbi:hypothetical protein AGLY_002179 [Aphis glycines]|uniref:Uncharacterized protein n=1 Tax=Aphis glycines TaxID=307491 RepID=A0A6G0U429_APHGL|nr:hypothetical protein AGLY_002179 [Aphis glycines]
MYEKLRYTCAYRNIAYIIRRLVADIGNHLTPKLNFKNISSPFVSHNILNCHNAINSDGVLATMNRCCEVETERYDGKEKQLCNSRTIPTVEIKEITYRAASINKWQKETALQSISTQVMLEGYPTVENRILAINRILFSFFDIDHVNPNSRKQGAILQGNITQISDHIAILWYTWCIPVNAVIGSQDHKISS